MSFICTPKRCIVQSALSVIEQGSTIKKLLYISVMGTMGSGKTTVARLLSKAFHFGLIEENFGENAFLPKFYQDMKQWAFHSQTFFLMEKISQTMETKHMLSVRPVVQDTPIQQDVFSYAKAQHVLGNMDDSEWRLYQKIYRSFEQYFPVPDLVIYLETSVPELSRRIASRGRGYERHVTGAYLELLDTLNHVWLAEHNRHRVLKVTTDGLNIVKSVKARETLIRDVRTCLRSL